MACESIQQQLNKLEVTQQILQEQAAEPGSGENLAQLRQELATIGEEIEATKKALAECLQQNAPPPTPPTPAPASILTITPVLPDTVANMEAKRDSTLASIKGKLFPQDAGREWLQPLAPDQDYDESLASCSGWMVRPRDNGTGNPATDLTKDFPFPHPFGADWEFSMALDKPAGAGGPFDYLLTPGNQVNSSLYTASEQSEQIEDQTAANALNLDFPLGLLGVEMDGGNVPASFKQNVADGNRVAVFGRWIIDTGHPMHRGEIHPPLLLVAASVTAENTTRAIFTSRPFLVSQLYTTDQSSVYSDSGSNDGTFYSHLLNEIVKINEFRSTLIECHPKVTQNPMQGTQFMAIQVRPPAQPASGPIGRAPVATAMQLAVSFHFTVRTGVALEVYSPAADTVQIDIVLQNDGYKAPTLPKNPGYRYSQSELQATSDVGNDYLEVEALSAAIQALLSGGVIAPAVVDAFLARGVQGDYYDSQTNLANPLDNENAVLNLPVSSLPVTGGITVNDTQPYPITGWVEAQWVSPVVANK